MGGMYGIRCKKEYNDTWPQKIKDGLSGFAAVEVIDFTKLFFIGEYTIFSPSNNYSITINPTGFTDHDNSDTDVYVVSDGGALHIWGYFVDDETELNILLRNWDKKDTNIFTEMYVRTTSILEKMKKNR